MKRNPLSIKSTCATLYFLLRQSQSQLTIPANERESQEDKTKSASRLAPRGRYFSFSGHNQTRGSVLCSEAQPECACKAICIGYEGVTYVVVESIYVTLCRTPSTTRLSGVAWSTEEAWKR